MAGVYIHIPFCKRKCAYCDFYSVARKDLIDDYVRALKIEIENADLKERVNTIYFGGGTPSMIASVYVHQILDTLKKQFDVCADAEITLEANPENINSETLLAWKNAGVNRLSIGVQSLNDDILRGIKRAHTAKDALDSISLAKKVGFDNISADLIYGLPGLSLSIWKESLSVLLSSGIQHLSSYHLGLEQGTLMYKQVEKGKIKLPQESESLKQFEFLFDYTEKNGFPWYEISNFAKPGLESKHNSSYWNSETYLGFGPAAHSFYNGERFWNQSDIIKYLENPKNVRLSESLSSKDILNDYFITHFRTRKGIAVRDIKQIAPWYDCQKLESDMRPYVNCGQVEYVDNMYRLKVKGLFISDAILKDIIYI